MNRKTIVLTGGGTAGHVMPHIAMLDDYKKLGWQVHYMGSQGIEKSIIANYEIPYHQIATGKLRRYLSKDNIVDIFRVIWGLGQAWWKLRKIKPNLVFSKGGFVSFPVAVAAWLQRIPVVSHESDLTPGLANKLISPFACKLFCAFPKTVAFVDAKKFLLTGIPVRQSLYEGIKAEGEVFCQFSLADKLPVILVMGGSIGSQRINDALKSILPQLLSHFRVVHITGKGKAIDFEHENYRSFEFIGEELAHVFAMSDYVVARAGANSIFEFLALTKPMLLIPLQIGSRGDQVDNAQCFQSLGLAELLLETDLTPESLSQGIEALVQNKDSLQQAQRRSSLQEDAREKIIPVLKKLMGEGDLSS